MPKVALIIGASIGYTAVVVSISFLVAFLAVKAYKKMLANSRRNKNLSKLQTIEDTVVDLRYRMDALEAQNESLIQTLDAIKDGLEVANERINEVISLAQPLDDDE